ncbi:P-loop containing nucleoside triphosphate hydrolase protein [Lasiosphaeris hirsuta]|uniref:P-loop containing nucleoside triphosphate hydrolase protein n=1 Tax=Lasiosphaeris hirsuta TaxID=260670 RepID=A0AA40E9L7_9PEZI|nr:P-loop containing nucleoside triphosphate hydrolase protein [Lasiosphaeris hirsuta]
MHREYAAELLECMEAHSEKIVFVVAGSGKKAMKFLGSRPHGKWFFRRRLALKDYNEEELRQILARLMYHNALDPEGGYDGPFVKIAAKRVARDRDTPAFGNVYDLISALNKMLDRHAARIGETRVKTVVNTDKTSKVAETEGDKVGDENDMEVPTKDDAQKAEDDAKKTEDDEDDAKKTDGDTDEAKGESDMSETDVSSAVEVETEKATEVPKEVETETDGNKAEPESDEPSVDETPEGNSIVLGSESKKVESEIEETNDVTVQKVEVEDVKSIGGEETKADVEEKENGDKASEQVDEAKSDNKTTSADKETDDKPEKTTDDGEKPVEESDKAEQASAEVKETLEKTEKVSKKPKVEAEKTVIKEPSPEVLRVLTMEDIIGPEPKDIRSESEAWKELEQMVGLDDVKKAIGALLDRAKANYRREVLGKEPLSTSLNRVFMGPPGTGKTTVAKLYGQVLAEIGLLSTKEVVMTTPGDFIGQYIGESEVKTGQILDATVGKVLVIDDAHMFYVGGRPGSGGHESDIFRLACIDTLISRIHNKPGEDRCVILLGYTEHLEEMFQKVNPGLLRRFPLEEAFRFTDYDDKRLNDILKLKMAKEDITADGPAMEVAAEVLRRARDRPNFGNGGDVDNLLTQAKTRFRERTQPKKGEIGESSDFTADFEVQDSVDEAIPIALSREDFDPEWDRGTKASRKCRQLFEGLIGFDGVIDKFQGYQRTAANLQRRGKNPKLVIPFNFLFKGPPGTGKTHTARIIGQVFYDMGFLSTNEVIECSASHLIGQYLGHTAPKVVNLFERALGKVLFIDEAYRLGAGSKGTACGSFEEEAIGEIVDCMTKTRYMRKMVIVLAGYDHDMEALMKVNPGLRGRFPTEIDFPPMSASRSRALLLNQLLKEDIVLRDLIEPSRDEKERVLRLFDKLSMSPGWANARDIKTLADQIMGHVYQKDADEEEGAEVGAQFKISTPELIGHLRGMLQQRVKGA